MESSKRWAGLACGVLLCAGSAYGQTPETHWLSLINATHENPQNMRVLVVPPLYFSQQALLTDSSWLGDPLAAFPGVQAALEAMDYWDWMLHDGPYAPPHLGDLSWTAHVLGVDATAEDISNPNIVVFTGMVTDPLPFIFHLGIGLPTVPIDAFLGGPGTSPQQICTVVNTGVGGEAGDQEPARLRNLVLHEFGHCISAGHTGTSLGFPHQSSDGTEYESHPTDLMSKVFGDERQCLSNLNVQSISEGYAFLPGPWQGHDGETFMLKELYETACMPEALQRF